MMHKWAVIISCIILCLSTRVSAQEEDMTEGRAIFAGGCFWCTEAAFDKVEGVTSTISGYIGGHAENPTYEQVSRGDSGYYEALEIRYDTDKLSYDDLLDVFWKSIDPTDAGGQFADRGSQYHTAIFALDDEQAEKAHASKEKVAVMLDAPIATKILPGAPFYPAEEKHQNYHQKNQWHYNAYYYGSGRPDKLKKVWGK